MLVCDKAHAVEAVETRRVRSAECRRIDERHDIS
jgi:hypothetical protein